MVDVGGNVFFLARHWLTGYELWRSDGTDVGTVFVKDVNPGPDDCIPVTHHGAVLDLIDIDGTLFFLATEPGTGLEVWRSDGTEAGTILLKDINPGPADSEPSQLTQVGGALFFTAIEPATGHELWRSDGTEAGTILVEDIVPGPSYSAPSGLTDVDGVLLFSAIDPDAGRELWRSDGEGSTVLIQDIVPGSGGSYPSSLTLAGELLFFTAHTIAGEELWAGHAAILTNRPEWAIRDLLAGVGELDLERRLQRRLAANLEVAERALAKGHHAVAIHSLEAFARKVEAMRGKQIPDSAASSLVHLTQDILDLLGG